MIESLMAPTQTFHVFVAVSLFVNAVSPGRLAYLSGEAWSPRSASAILKFDTIIFDLGGRWHALRRAILLVAKALLCFHQG